MPVEKRPVKTSAEIEALFPVVEKIWQEVFTPIIGAQQVAYMMAHYQSIAAITAEINAGAHYFLLVKDGQAVGYTAYEETPEQIYLSKIYLSADSRGQGLSTDVFDWYEELACGKKLHLNVNQGNERAIAVYEHRGFKRVGERYVEIGEGYIMNDYIYEKDLANA